MPFIFPKKKICHDVNLFVFLQTSEDPALVIDEGAENKDPQVPDLTVLAASGADVVRAVPVSREIEILDSE